MLDSKSIFTNSLNYAREHGIEIAVLAKALDLQDWEFMALAASETGPSWEQLGKICATLGVDFSKLMTEAPKPVKPERTVVDKYREVMSKLEGEETLSEELIDKLYGGVLGKVIGNHVGIPVENQSSTAIIKEYPHITGYLWDLNGKTMHPDDDLNGFFTFAEVLDKANSFDEITAKSLQETILDKVSYYRGFYWWDSNNSETTGFENLLNEVDSTQEEFHNKLGDEGIAGQIFYESLGLVSLGDVDLAVELTKRLVPVNCLGEALNGSIFVNACVSLAFEVDNPLALVEKALGVVPNGKVAEAVRRVVEFYKINPYDWRDCLSFVESRYTGYKTWDFDSIVAASILYGRGDFNRSLEICMQFGTDTDCTVSNVCTILGVLNGAKGINEGTWIKPLRDTVLLSTALGDSNIVSISDFTCKLAYNTARLHGLALPEEYYCYSDEALHRFTLKGGTYGAFTYSVDSSGNQSNKDFRSNNCAVVSTSEITGDEYSKGMLFKRWQWYSLADEVYCTCFPTYFMKDWINGHNYEPTNSPRVFPGQTVSMRFYTLDNDCGIKVKLFAIDQKGRTLGESEVHRLKENKWVEVEFTIPHSDQIVTGIVVATSLDSDSQYNKAFSFNGFAYYVDAIRVSGSPSYSITSETLIETNGATLINSYNNLVGVHNYIEQITPYAGALGVSYGSIVLEANNEYKYSSPEGLGMITFGPTLREYKVSMVITPQQDAYHLVLFGVKGAKTMYAFGFYGKNTVKLLKVEKIPGDFVPLHSSMNTQYNWNLGEQYELGVKFSNGELELTINREICFRQAVTDVNNFTGCFGFANVGDSSSLINSVTITSARSKRISVEEYTEEKEFLALDDSTKEVSVEFIDAPQSEVNNNANGTDTFVDVDILDEDEDADSDIDVEPIDDEEEISDRDDEGFIRWYSEGENDDSDNDGIFINDED